MAGIAFYLHDNPYISKAGLAELVHDMSAQSYRLEILAEDDEIQLSWLVYKAFNEIHCRKPVIALPLDWPIYVGHDFGQANPAAIFFARDYKRNELHTLAEYFPGAGSSIAQHVEAFKGIVEGRPVAARVGGNWTTEEEIRQGYTTQGWPIQKPRWKEVKLQLDHVIALMERNQIIVYENVPHYLEEIQNCLWQIGADGKPLDKIQDEAKYHLCAAARYVLSDFTPETVEMGKTKSYISWR